MLQIIIVKLVPSTREPRHTFPTMRRNEFDVTNRVNTTLPDEVADEVLRIYRDLYQCDQSNNLPQMFEDVFRSVRTFVDGSA